jgi:uncharacterized protein
MEDFMSKKLENKIYYFDNCGPTNTMVTLEIALSYCKSANIKKIVVASSTGETALNLREKAGDSVEIIAVTFSAGSNYREEVERFNRNQQYLINKGIKIVRGLHAFSGVERSFEEKYKSGFVPLNIISDTLRIFSQGIKVCVEISVMAAENGLISPDEDIIVIGGSDTGADTAILLKPAYAANIFETRIKAILCMPV